MKQCVIISGGCVATEELLNYIKNCHESPFLIGVDGGAKVIFDLKLEPDLLIGDFDTLDKVFLDEYIRNGFIVEVLNPIKDATDTQMALERALELQMEWVAIFGGTGTRLDHTLGNLMMVFSYIHKLHIEIIDAHNVIYFLSQKKAMTFYKKHSMTETTYQYLSYLPMTQCYVKETIGLKYPMKDRILYANTSLGVSNEIIFLHGSIHQIEGNALVILSND